MTTTGSNDVIGVVRQDHAEIKQLLKEVARKDSNRRDAFARLAAKLRAHETAEEAIVHPLARTAPNGADEVDARIAEEDEGMAALAKLERMGVDDPKFDATFKKLRKAVLAHAEHEESEE